MNFLFSGQVFFFEKLAYLVDSFFPRAPNNSWYMLVDTLQQRRSDASAETMLGVWKATENVSHQKRGELKISG